VILFNVRATLSPSAMWPAGAGATTVLRGKDRSRGVVLDAVEKLDTSGTVLRASLIVARSAVSVLAEGGPGRAMVARSVFEQLESQGSASSRCI
jgi:hypothetical protein